MGSARLIAAVTLLVIIARGQARPLDTPLALQNGSHTEDTINDIVPPAKLQPEEPTEASDTEKMAPETTQASMENEEKLPSEDLTGGDSESKVTNQDEISSRDSVEKPHDAPEKKTEDRTVSEDEITSNDSTPNGKPEDVVENKTEDKSKSAVSDNSEELVNLQLSTSTAKNSVSSDQNIATPSPDSADQNNIAPSSSGSEEQTFNPSISTELQTTERHNLSALPIHEDSKSQHAVVVETPIQSNNETKVVDDTSITQANPAKAESIPASTQDTPLIHHDRSDSPTEVSSAIERATSTQISNSTDISDRSENHTLDVSPSNDIEIEAEGAEGSSSDGQMASSSDWLITAVTVAVAMDGIVKALSSSTPSASSTMALSNSSLSEEQLSASSFVDSSISKTTPTPDSSLSQLLTELPESPFVDTSILKGQSISTTQAPVEMAVSTSEDTRVISDVGAKAAQDSLLSTTRSQASTELPVSSIVDTAALNNLSSPVSSAPGSPQELAETPIVSSSILEDTPSSTLTQGPASSSVDTPTPSAVLPLSPASAEHPASSIEDLIPSPVSPLLQVSAELPTSSSMLEDPSSLTLPDVPLSSSFDELPEHSFGNGDSSSPAAEEAVDAPTVPLTPLDAAQVPLPSPEALREPKFADMELAETMVFRPVFSYRQDSASRRRFRSLGDQRNYL